MSPAERTILRTWIDRARRAQLDADGGYHHVERVEAERDRKAGIFQRRPRLHLERPLVEKRDVGWMTETWGGP